MFNVYEIFEYLLRKAFARRLVSFVSCCQAFNVNMKDNIQRAIFKNYLEAAEKRIVRDVLNDEVIPIYTVILYMKADNLPGDGFFDVFMNRNRQEFQKIAGNMTFHDVCHNYEIKKKIFDRAIEFLKNDLDKRFPDENSIYYFIQEVKQEKDIEINHELENLYALD